MIKNQRFDYYNYVVYYFRSFIISYQLAMQIDNFMSKLPIFHNLNLMPVLRETDTLTGNVTLSKSFISLLKTVLLLTEEICKLWEDCLE